MLSKLTMPIQSTNIHQNKIHVTNFSQRAEVLKEMNITLTANF